VTFLEPRTSATNNNQQQNNQYSSSQQQNYTRVEEDPFSSGSGPIEVSDDDLPF
jgi:single-strand DNA-binding protein